MSTAGSFNTSDVRSWQQPQADTSKDVQYAKPYVAPPRLPMGLSFLDIDRNANIRVKTFASNVTSTGFKVSVDSWGDSKLYTGGVSWLELAPANLEYQCGQFSTTDDHPWNQPQLETSRRINFDRPFVTPPNVIVSLNELDMSKDRNWRVTATATDIDTTGFTIHINTWADSVLYSATATWIAYPEDRKYVVSGSANVTDVRPWTTNQLENSKSVSFAGADFWKAPSVFMAINSLDIDQKANLRLKVYPGNVTKDGMTWHADSWGDTVLYSAGLSYICLV